MQNQVTTNRQDQVAVSIFADFQLIPQSDQIQYRFVVHKHHHQQQYRDRKPGNTPAKLGLFDAQLPDPTIHEIFQLAKSVTIESITPTACETLLP